MGVFEKAGTSDRYRGVDHLEECEKIVFDSARKLAFEEVAENFFVRRIAEGYGVEAVRLHELIENVGAEHNGARNGY